MGFNKFVKKINKINEKWRFLCSGDAKKCVPEGVILCSGRGHFVFRKGSFCVSKNAKCVPENYILCVQNTRFVFLKIANVCRKIANVCRKKEKRNT